jgi:hypothetical protein
VTDESRLKWASNRIEDLESDLARARMEVHRLQVVIQATNDSPFTTQRDLAYALRDQAVSALAGVMRTLGASAGSPAENAAWERARGVLAEAGVAGAEVAEYQAAYAEWASRR